MMNAAYGTVSHKGIGLTYLIIALLLGMVGTVCSNLIRLECICSGSIVLCSSNISVYNLIITVHGLVMVFWFIMPGLFGSFGNIWIPSSLGCADVSYPLLNTVSVLLLIVSFIVVLGGLVLDYIAGAGWTLYAPLSIVGTCVSYLGIIMVVIGLIVVGYSSTFTSANFLATIAMHRCPQSITSITE